VANVEYRVCVVWNGRLIDGNGILTGKYGREFSDVSVSFAPRTQSPPEGTASPEELIASGHASCYAMALSNVLAKQGTPPQRLTVDAVWTLDDELLEITNIDLNVRCEVSGINEKDFDRAAR
jgi:osmotically inducible protein OsmC